jgi:AsmA family protein
MSRRRLVVIVLSIVGALLLAIVLYLAFADLGRHKGRIEAFVTRQVGRPFAIDGAFELQLVPSVSVLAERVRVGNAEWGSQPQMLEIGP